MIKRIPAILVLLAALTTFRAEAQPFRNVDTYTSRWPPYVEGEGEPKGLVSRVVKLVFNEFGRSPTTHYVNYSLSYRLVERGDISVSYPYFLTSDRKDEVLFSNPILKVENSLFFSSRHNDASTFDGDFSNLRIGRVSGYSYGERIDKLVQDGKAFNQEVSALFALLSGQIDLLPMTAEVARSLTIDYFPHLMHELERLDRYTTRDPVHVVFSNNTQGRKLRSEFNTALSDLRSQGLLENEVISFSSNLYESSGFVRLVPVEGFPVVVGQTSRSESDAQFYFIPQKSRAIVLDWSQSALKSGRSEDIYRKMTELSKVQVIDGPLKGKEIYVKNMYISID